MAISMLEKLKSINESVKKMDENITRVELSLIKNKYSGMVTQTEDESGDLFQLLKARLEKNKNRDSRVTALLSQANVLLLVLKDKSQLLSNLENKKCMIVTVNKVSPFDVETIVRRAYQNKN
jgi:hypothetical protein